MNKINITKDLLVSIKNAYSTKNKYAYCRISKVCLDILWTLYKDGLIQDYRLDSTKNQVKVTLKYLQNKPLFQEIELISKPKLQKYGNSFIVNRFNKKYDYIFVSTSTGIISSTFLLQNIKIGGQLLFGLRITAE